MAVTWSMTSFTLLLTYGEGNFRSNQEKKKYKPKNVGNMVEIRVYKIGFGTYFKQIFLLIVRLDLAITWSMTSFTLLLTDGKGNFRSNQEEKRYKPKNVENMVEIRVFKIGFRTYF